MEYAIPGVQVHNQLVVMGMEQGHSAILKGNYNCDINGVEQVEYY